MPTLKVIIRHKATPKSTDLIRVLWCSGDDWGCWLRYLNSHGYRNFSEVASREMTPSETVFHEKQYRMLSHQYDSWEDLIDAMLIDKSEDKDFPVEWIPKLVELAKECPSQRLSDVKRKNIFPYLRIISDHIDLGAELESAWTRTF